MKKIIALLLALVLVSCSPSQGGSDSNLDVVPNKINVEGLTVLDSSINPSNLDLYLDRDDTTYIDLRYFDWFISDGYIKGFKSVPFYDFLITRSGVDGLFLLDDVKGVDYGMVGCYKPIYEESVIILNKLIPMNKNVFLISQSGLESIYASALLAQMGYDLSKVYNVGAISISATNIPSYINVGKNFVRGNTIISSSSASFKVDFSKLHLKLIK